MSHDSESLSFPPPGCMWWSAALSSLALFPQAARGCSRPCSCPPSLPSCPLGVSWVLDECGCCKVCAQQYNQDCGPDRPCDHIKGLRCHLGAGGDPRRGLCRGENNTRQLWDCFKNNGCECVILQLVFFLKGQLIITLKFFLIFIYFLIFKVERV